MATPCYVYMIVAEDAPTPSDEHSIFKVGISENPYTRMAGFQTANPYRLSLHSKWRLPSREIANSVERAFHKQNRSYKMTGEWFMSRPRYAVHDIHYEIAKQLSESFGYGRGLLLETALVEAGLDFEDANLTRLALYGEQDPRREEDELLSLYLEALGLE